jgi:hypothetical protein
VIRLAWTLNRAGGWGRMLLLTGCTAVVSGLLLVAIALLLLPPNPHERLFNLVAEPGTRAGTAFATVMLTLPPLLLLHQAVRLGTAARERRLASLRLAGATPSEVRRLGAIEVGFPALAGSLLGFGVYALLRWTLGGTASASPVSVPGLKLVPTTVAPTWWQFLIVVVGVTIVGVAVGLLASRRVVVTPLGITRRQSPPPPRPWGLLLVGLAVALGLFGSAHEFASDVLVVAAVALVILGVVSLASWTAYRVGRFAESRVTSAPALLAARRLVAEPRPAGRAAAAVGGIALVAGGSGAIIVEILTNGRLESYFVLSLTLVGLALLASLLVVMGTLAVHSVESLLDRKRSMAALAALGTPLGVLQSSQRLEAALVAMPMALVGVLFGGGVLGFMQAPGPLGVLVILATVVVTLGLVGLAILTAVRATRPWAVRAAAAGNLRAE